MSIDLRVWGKAWGIPSVDPICLSAITYAKFSLAPIEEIASTPADTVTGSLPELELDEMVYADLFSIISIFRREGYNADFNLTTRQQADTLAFLSYIERKLKPAILYSLWLDGSNYTNVTRPAYSKLYGFPRSLWYPGKMREKMETYISNCGSFKKKKLHEIEKILYQEARECMDVLEKRLGKEKYFFGERPTTLDAVCYGHLAILLNAPLLSTEIKIDVKPTLEYNTCSSSPYLKSDIDTIEGVVQHMSTKRIHLHSCEKLKNHCYRIEKFFVKRTTTSSTSNKSSSSRERNDIVSNLPNKDTIITVGVGVSLMMLFAAVQGIFTSKSSLLARQLESAHIIASTK